MYIAKDIHELKEKAIPITEEVEFFNPIPPTKRITLSGTAFTAGYSKSYAIENGIITFLDEALNWFTIPALKGVQDFLKLQGYKQVGIFVPGADGSYPVQHQEHWKKLIQQRDSGF